jgi:YfiH family protein
MKAAIYQKEFSQAKFEVFAQEPNFPVIKVKQVHGITILKDDEINSEADGIYTLKDDIKLAIVTADCIPLVVKGKKGFAHIHAGWRGVCDNIMTQFEVQNLSPEYFFLGPHIQSCCYEVAKDFTENFPASDNFRENKGKIYFDLAKEAENRIKSIFPDSIVEHSGVCTCCNQDFHSYRRNKTPLRNWNILSVNKV